MAGHSGVCIHIQKIENRPRSDREEALFRGAEDGKDNDLSFAVPVRHFAVSMKRGCGGAMPEVRKLQTQESMSKADLLPWSARKRAHVSQVKGAVEEEVETVTCQRKGRNNRPETYG